MDINLVLEKMPLLWVYVVTVVIVFLSIISGFGLGNYFRRRRKNEKDASIGSIIGALLGLLALVLAFTFGIAASFFADRKQVLLDEVNAIGTAYLRTDFLADSEAAETRKLYKKYVDIRLEAARNLTKLPQVLIESEKLLDQLWLQATASSKKNVDSILLGLYIESLNEVIDLHTIRITIALQYRIPASIWIALYFVTILTMLAVGYEFGQRGVGSFFISLIMALAFSVIILLIADLDRTKEGLIQVSQKPMIELQQKLNASTK